MYQNQNSQKKEYNIPEPNFWIKYLIGHLYLIQGFFYGFFNSVPLTYKKIPSYKILSMFDTAALPFSFKFLLAPIQQRFTSRRYGRRKTWIVINIFLSAIGLLLLSCVVGEEEYQVMAAVLLFLCIFATAMKDIGADALAVQQISHTPTISIASFAGEQIGKVVTLSVFMALISKNYWVDYGIKEAIMSPATFMRIIVGFIVLSGLAIHLFFKQKLHQVIPEDSQEQQIQKMSLWQIVGHYKHFVMPKYRLFRQSLIILLMNHGILYFTSTYSIEAIKNGINKQTLMFADNFCFIPSITLSYIISRHLTPVNITHYLQTTTILKFTFSLFVYLLDIKHCSTVIAIFVIMNVLGSIHYYIQMSIINQISKGRFSAITVTALLSISNFSRTTALQKQMIYLMGFQSCMIFGFIYAGIVVLVLPYANRWASRGICILHLKQE